jgi:hypothetical protein
MVEGMNRLSHPHELRFAPLAQGVAVFAPFV